MIQKIRYEITLKWISLYWIIYLSANQQAKDKKFWISTKIWNHQNKILVISNIFQVNYLLKYNFHIQLLESVFYSFLMRGSEILKSNNFRVHLR